MSEDEGEGEGENEGDGVPIKDYLLRYDRGAFRVGMYGYERFFVAFWYVFYVF